MRAARAAPLSMTCTAPDFVSATMRPSLGHVTSTTSSASFAVCNVSIVLGASAISTTIVPSTNAARGGAGCAASLHEVASNSAKPCRAKHA